MSTSAFPAQLRRARPVLLALALGACAGSVGGGGSADQGQEPRRPSHEPPSPGDKPASACAAPTGALRRVTRDELENSLRDVFGDALLGAGWRLPDAFPADERPEHLYVGLGVSNLWASKMLETAELVAGRVTQDFDRFQTQLCGASAKTEQACLEKVITGLGQNLYRRALSGEEVENLRQLYADVRRAADGVAGDHREGLQAVVQGLLSAPHFYYQAERDSAAAGTTVTITGHEMARRLASFLWRSTPDEALLAAAAAGQLSTDAQVRQQARRMVALPRTRASLSGFFRQWLDLTAMGEVEKTDALFTPALGEAMVASVLAGLEAATWQDRKSFADVLASREVFMDASVAPLFGMPAGKLVRGTFSRVTVNDPERVGLLTHPALLTLLAKPAKSDYILRGKFVREQLFCQLLGAPPPAAMGRAEEVAAQLGPDASARALAEAHSSEPSCKACHALIDPIGLALEGFDELGRFRTSYKGKPIDTTGALTGSDVDGAIRGAGDLAGRLARSEMVNACFAQKLLTYALGGVMDETAANCHAETLARPAPIADLLVEVAASPALRTRKVSAEPGARP